MKFGPTPPKRLPKQDSAKVLLIAERWQRSSWAHQRWAEPAKRAVDFVEGRQWTEKQLQDMIRQRRPALTFNIIAPLLRLVQGYFASNKTDIVHKPGQDSRSSEDTAATLSQLEKAIAHWSKLEFIDTEVFMDGLMTGRGWYDTRLDFEKNDLGEIMTRAWDPFQVFPDPDADTYDLNESAAYINTAKMVSVDEIEGSFGPQVASLIRPFTMGTTPLAPLSSMILNDEITPVRTFGEKSDFTTDYWDQFYALAGDFVDTHRKTIRIIEQQHKIHEQRNVVIDLETGDKKVLPKEWDDAQIQKIMLYGQQIGNPLTVERRMCELLQWTTLVGDLMLYDQPSMYERYTLNGYFPYFRRGMTRGMVADLIDPQMEKNKHRSARVEIMSKTANGGWSYHESALDPVQERNLKKFGSTPGVNVKWKGEHEPKAIQPTTPPIAHERLEKDSDNDVHQISGINESALGELDRVQSGRAIEARQRQAVLSIQMYMDNHKRTKEQLGDTHLSIIQKHYTEARIYRVMGEDGHMASIDLNKRLTDPNNSTVVRILNDVTVGKYVSSVDDSPLSATFLNAQFEEMLMLVEKMGPAIGPYLPAFADLMVDMSTLPRKDEWIARFKAVAQSMGMGAAGGTPPGGGGPAGGPPGGPALPPPGAAGPPAIGGPNGGAPLAV